MKTQNFKIDSDMISVEYAGKSIDIHNCYEFEGFTYEEYARSAQVVFKKMNEDWVDHDLPLHLRFVFSEVEALHKQNISKKDTLNEDEKTLDIFGFSERGDSIMNGPSDTEKSRNDLQAFLFCFLSGGAIKVEADTVLIKD